MKGRIEHEIRLLPQVLACSFSEQGDIVVLIDPSAEAWAVQVSVERILAAAGASANIRIVGPEPYTRPARFRPISPLVATATVGTVAAVGLGALFGGLIAVQQPRPPAEIHQTRTVPVAGAPFDSLDILRGIQGTGEQPAPALTPVETPDGHAPVFEVGLGQSGHEVALGRPAQEPKSTTATGTEEQALHGLLANRRGAPRARHGKHRGDGPRPWSESVLLPPHAPGDPPKQG